MSRRGRARACALAVLTVCVVAGARAALAPSVAADPALEARVDALSAELRCLVCQNQSLADSHAGLALDLKNQVREQLRAGRSEAQVIDYMTERYGDFVLYKPPWKATTALLWGGPALLALLGMVLAWRTLRRGARDAVGTGAADGSIAAANDTPFDPLAAQLPEHWRDAAPPR
jgi:cytochrome c-type biogenesis protein CcmH